MKNPRVHDEVIEACRKGDRDALHHIFLACKDRVYSTALHFFGGDRAAAADITQEVFLKLAGRIEQFRGESEFTTWLHRIVVNACLDELRRRRRVLFLEDSPEILDMRADSRENTAPPELVRAVEQAVASLKPKLRITILLKYFEGLSYDEIAAVLGCSRGTVASRLNRGHAILARRLGGPREEIPTGGGHV